MNRQELTETLREVLHEQRQIDDDRHAIHHQFIESIIRREERNRARWEKFRLSIIGTFATALVGGLIWVGKIVLEAVSRGHHPQ